MALDPERALEAALDRLNKPFALSLAPGVIGLGVQQADTQVRAHDVRVLTHERLALVGVQFEGQAPPEHRLLQRIEESFGVSLAVVSRKRD